MKINTNTRSLLHDTSIEIENDEQLFVKAGEGFLQIFIDGTTGELYLRMHGGVIISKSSKDSNSYIKERFKEEK